MKGGFVNTAILVEIIEGLIVIVRRALGSPALIALRVARLVLKVHEARLGRTIMIRSCPFSQITVLGVNWLLDDVLPDSSGASHLIRVLQPFLVGLVSLHHIVERLVLFLNHSFVEVLIVLIPSLTLVKLNVEACSRWIQVVFIFLLLNKGGVKIRKFTYHYVRVHVREIGLLAVELVLTDVAAEGLGVLVMLSARAMHVNFN